MNELNRKNALAKLIEELDRLHLPPQPGTELKREETAAFGFVTARNGRQRHFSHAADRALLALAQAWQKEAPRLAIKVETKELVTLLRQTVADFHAEGKILEDAKQNLRTIDDYVQQILNQTATDFTHSFPARTAEMECVEPFVIGPVTIMTRKQWLDTVDFSRGTKQNTIDGEVANRNWKTALLRELLPRKDPASPDHEPMPWLAASMYAPLKTGRSMVRVTLSGYERSLSSKAARHICKTALDGLSLILGGNSNFHIQTLADERMPPVSQHTIIEQNGFLLLPGLALTPQIPFLTGHGVKRELEREGARTARAALANILDGLVTPDSHRHPLLAMRWATALDWLAEGTREANEAIALAKIGTSLDVLTEGGKFGRILDMLTHLTGWSEEKEFRVGPYPRTLRWLVKELYDHGRSKILHGNVFDRLQSFAEMRSVGAELARVALIHCALRLQHYEGEDGITVFRDIPACSPQNPSD